MEPNLPANPLSIELTLSHARLWWHVDAGDGLPERWTVSADLWDLDLCADEERHVGDIELAVASFTRAGNLVDSTMLGEPAMRFMAEAVIDPEAGKVHAELDARISPGPARMVVLRRIEVTEPWRGYGLGAALIAGALRALAPSARLAAVGFAAGDELSAELENVRLGRMLEHIGFFRWRDAHVVDLNSPALLEARTELFRQWWPGQHIGDGAD